jgi:hypothetical protein
MPVCSPSSSVVAPSEPTARWTVLVVFLLGQQHGIDPYPLACPDSENRLHEPLAADIRSDNCATRTEMGARSLAANPR